MSEQATDCLACRIISGTGCIGIGAYLAYQSRPQTRRGYIAMNLLAVGFGLAGFARLFNFLGGTKLPNKEPTT